MALSNKSVAHSLEKVKILPDKPPFHMRDEHNLELSSPATLLNRGLFLDKVEELKTLT